MAKGDRQAAAVVARIRSSTLSLILHYPPARTAAVVTGPAVRPVSPLTGPRSVPLLVNTPAAPERVALTVQCLWLDAPAAERATGDVVARPLTGWLEGATALARCVWSDVAVSSTDATLGSWFDRALYIEFRGIRWHLIKTEPMGPGFRAPHSLSVWLAGSGKE